MKTINFLLISLVCLCSISAPAQKMVPHSFLYQAESSDRESLGRNQLRFLTQVTQPNTTFLRLYFAGTQLGEGSYLVLEGADGSRQELRKQDLENWRYSSAYFNGQSVNVSLFAAAGENNVVRVSEIKVTDPQIEQARNARQAAGTLGAMSHQATSTPANLTETYPHAKAVGRFTNGSDSYGTGWIAPNGAIVTSSFLYHGSVLSGSYDIIEFNVPPSEGYTVRHPSPQDQYPVSTASGEVVYNVIPYLLKNGNGIGASASYAILTPLPNSTGLRPGERQEEYFRISTNPRSSDIHDAGSVPASVMHYGAYPGDHYNGQFRTLHLYETSLLEQNEHLSANHEFAGERDEFVLYGGAGLVNMTGAGTAGSDGGAPVTYGITNIAMGVHEIGFTNGASVGVGFRNNDFRNSLARFFTTTSAYVDEYGVNNSPTGEINKPYHTVQQAAQHLPDDYTVYIARGTYSGAVTFSRPMTLRAPVGKVIIGSSNAGARQAAGLPIPQELQEEGSSLSYDRESAEDRRVQAYPNPFKEQTEIKYPFADGGPVSVRIFNMAGVPVAAFTHNYAASGQNGVQWNGTDQNGTPVPAGLYLVKVNYGNQTFTTKVLKN